jgi:hypothetical protein
MAFMNEEPRDRRFRFGLRTLFAAVTLIAIAIALARVFYRPEPRLEAIQPGMTLRQVKQLLNDSRLKLQTGGGYQELTATGSRIVRRAALHYQWPDGNGGIVHFVYDDGNLRATEVTVVDK